MHPSRNGTDVDSSAAPQNARGGRLAASSADVARVLFRHKWKATFFFGATIGLTVVTALFYPRSYISEAKLIVRVGRETATLDPTATTGHVVYVQKSHERDINSALEILRSQLLVEQVVDAIGVDAILKNLQGQGPFSQVMGFLKADELDPITDREKAILMVKEQIRISAAEGADVLTISAKTSDPQSSQVVLRQFLDAFVSLHGRLSRTQGGHTFFQRQTDLVRSELSKASATLRDAKNEYELLTVEGKQTILNSQLAGITDQLSRIEADLAYSEAKASELANSVDALPSSVVTESVDGRGNAATDSMRTQLYELEIRERELASMYEDDHPLLVKVRQQRKAVEEIFKQQPSQRTEVTNALNLTRQQLALNLWSEKASTAALRSKRKSLLARVQELNGELAALNDQEHRIAELEGEVERLTATYQKYADRREEARIDQALEAERISSINVVQPPTLSERPAAPRPVHIIAIGLFLATIGALLLVVVANYFDSSFITSEQVERQLELPVLVSIPRTSRRRLVQLN